MKNKYFSFMKLNKFEYGNRPIYQFIVFECKFIFSIIFFYFPKSFNKQDRFHTHAFNGLSIKLFGAYMEHILLDENTGEYETRNRTEIFRWFPKNHYHLIGRSPVNCLTLLLSGPWDDEWKEWKEGEVTHYSWGRELKF